MRGKVGVYRESGSPCEGWWFNVDTRLVTWTLLVFFFADFEFFDRGHISELPSHITIGIEVGDLQVDR